ncbi:hypothetical protein WKI68_34660 [Streptomyces sp. MS1.HAVA.3]|uniref:Uncharacterized protein n=1 Tax=Streptomyces caledonius TaxID=3134107 RepID=A0ABU8UCF6_9ACTN
MSSILALRNWLQGIRPEELSALLIRREEAHGRESIRFAGGPAEARLRKPAGSRIWVTKAPPGLLTDLAICGTGMARARLLQLGFTAAEVSEPDLGTLERMMLGLPPTWAGLALYGLALGKRFTVSTLVRENWDRLWSAGQVSAELPGESDRASILSDHHGTQHIPDEGSPVGGADEPVAETEDGVPDLAAAEQAVAALREHGEQLAEELTACAEAVRTGSSGRAASIAEIATAWLAERDALSLLVGRLDPDSGPWQPQDSYEAVDEVLAGVRRRLQDSAELVAKLEALDSRRGTYLQMLEDAVSDVERQQLQSMINRFTADMAALQGPETDPSPGSSSEEPARPASAEPPVVAQSEEEEEEEEETEQAPALGTGSHAPQVEPSWSSSPAPGEQVAPHGRTVETSAVLTLDEVREPGSVDSPMSVWNGNRPPVQRLIEQGRLAEAYWLTLAAKEPAPRAQVLAFAHAAFHSPQEQGQVFELQIAAEDHELPDTSEDREAYLVALAASLRTGLVAGWPLRIVTEFVPLQGLPKTWARLLDELVGTVKQAICVSPGEVLRTSAGNNSTLRQKIGAQASQLSEELPQRTIKLARGTQVLQTLARDGALARTLRLVQDWAEGQVGADALAADMDQNYRRSDAADRLIVAVDRQIRTPKQAKQDIHSSARDQLRQHIKSVVDLLREALAVAESAATNYQNRGLGSDLPRAVAAARQAAPLPGPGGAALSLLLQWLCGKSDLRARALGLSLPATVCWPWKDWTGARSTASAHRIGTTWTSSPWSRRSSGHRPRRMRWRSI